MKVVEMTHINMGIAKNVQFSVVLGTTGTSWELLGTFENYVNNWVLNISVAYLEVSFEMVMITSIRAKVGICCDV